MGQRHSQNTAEDADTATVKQDYYELLGIERTASEDEVKKAYRRKALELHPDRNHGNEEWATKLFAEVQAAHEILSDPQERAWYDSHRDVLLRGGDPEQGEEYSYNIRMTSADEVLGLMMNFRNAPMTDSPTGFYGGLNDFFTQLAKEEDVACQWQDLDSLDYPEFGLKDDDYADTVRPFYGAWASFATKKSYAWKEKYRLSDAPDRYIRRLMDKENQKVREEAKQEFNDAVRSLVAFVRKRDPRVKDSKQSEAERQKALQEAAAAQRARAQAQRQAAMERHAENGVSSWIHQAAKDEHEGGFSSESEVEEHEYDCVVCDKTFKSEKQFHAHEKSKKHLKLLKELKWEMRKEGKELELEGENDVSEPASEQEKSEKRAEGFLEREEEEPEFTTAKHENPPNNNGKSEQHGSGTESEDTDVDNDDYAPRTEVVDRLDDKAVKDMEEVTSHPSLEDNDTSIVSGAETPSSKKLGKAKQKRAKKAAQQEEADSEAPDGFSCVICSAQFPSKTKLFDHIKVKGHAAPLNEVRTDRKGAKSNNNKKKKK